MTGKPRQRPGESSPLRPRLVPQVEGLRVGDGSPTPEATESQTPAVPESQTPEPPESGSTGVTESQTQELAAEEVPRYLTLVRKEARIRADQVDALADLRRRVARNRANRSEVITDNTLIRIGIDMLLDRQADLRGDTEDELRRSVLPDSQTDRTPE